MFLTKRLKKQTMLDRRNKDSLNKYQGFFKKFLKTFDENRINTSLRSGMRKINLIERSNISVFKRTLPFGESLKARLTKATRKFD
jgi:hypothetical protein